VKWRIAQPYDPRPVDVEAVTIDAYGTLIELTDPVPPLQAALAARGVERTDAQVRAAFAAEVAFYVVRSYEGRDAATLAGLRRDCTAVFLEAAAAPLDPDEFVPAFVDSIAFEELPGAADSLRDLAAARLRLAIVSNWDIGLHDHLAALGLDRLVDTVVTSAEAGAPKPGSAVFHLALTRLGADAARTVHIGDSATDADGARAAGMRFEPAPLADAAARILR
jgi:HAD superfamily hydrolase (TIGR01509 family)